MQAVLAESSVKPRFSDRPGPRERQLKRRHDSPLFPEAFRSVDFAELARVQQQDLEERGRFESDFLELVREASELKPTEESEVILALKARLDRAYVVGSGLAGDNLRLLAALRQLITAVMGAVRRGAEGDPVALAELDQEQLAREQNYHLLGWPLVSDLMRPDSPVPADELAATLLSESVDAIEAALWLFDDDALAPLTMQCRALVEGLEARGEDSEAYRLRLGAIEAATRRAVSA